MITVHKKSVNTGSLPDSFCAHIGTKSAQSAAIRQGIADARKRGVEWGVFGKELAKRNRLEADAFAYATLPVLREIGFSGAFYKKDGTPRYLALARQLNALNVPTANGGKWYATTVRRVIDRLGPTFKDEILQMRLKTKCAEALEAEQKLKELLK
ncbi:hypothetical protein [Magnetovibrio sp.]|uniref:hypothetical protein n=1 Tax=Magnetovibrio sp. TaxID=2024836 RepID=UPI002F935D49